VLEHPSEENAEPYSWRSKLFLAGLELLFDALASFGRKFVMRLGLVISFALMGGGAQKL